MRNIIVAFTDHPAAQKIRTILIYNGYSVAGVCTSGAQVINLARRIQGGGVVVCSNKFHDMNTEFLAEQLSAEYDFLMLLHSNEATMDSERGIYSLQLPLKKSDLLSSVQMLLTTRQLKAVQPETTSSSKEMKREDKPQRSPEERKMIADAKNILMDRNHLTEEQAHRFLQKRSMDSGNKLIDTARAVIEGW